MNVAEVVPDLYFTMSNDGSQRDSMPGSSNYGAAGSRRYGREGTAWCR